MEIGRLRHRIDIESQSLSTDSQGGSSRTWATRATVWSSIKPLRSEERFYNEQLKLQTTHEIIIRYLSTVLSTDRIKFGSRYFEIVSLKNIDEAGKLLIILAKETS